MDRIYCTWDYRNSWCNRGVLDMKKKYSNLDWVLLHPIHDFVQAVWDSMEWTNYSIEESDKERIRNGDDPFTVLVERRKENMKR